ncbi:MAG: heavy metal-binding domain-containing protein [Deltaproteobacteria bacterium]|nr:heavy metal-binding domain-containing protein [Deltaproteobacteria bacterium]
MEELELLIYFSGFIFLFLLGLIVGGRNEKNHLKKLDIEEKELEDIHCSDIKSFPEGVKPGSTITAVSAQVVIANDYFKTLAGSLRNIFGGEVKSYELLIRRGRREAVVRLKKEARELGLDTICNIRFETSNISNGAEVLVYGTAYERNT